MHSFTLSSKEAAGSLLEKGDVKGDVLGSWADPSSLPHMHLPTAPRGSWPGTALHATPPYVGLLVTCSVRLGEEPAQTAEARTKG